MMQEFALHNDYKQHNKVRVIQEIYTVQLHVFAARKFVITHGSLCGFAVSYEQLIEILTCMVEMKHISEK